MLAPRSYTREDVVELQCHGSDVCLNRVLRACLQAGARLAEPGWALVFIFYYALPENNDITIFHIDFGGN